MATVKWQSNDVLSVVTVDKNRGVAARPKVRTGFINLEVPDASHFEFLEELGKNLNTGFRVLSPTEALRIKYNLNAQDMTAERKVNGVSLWKIVFERYHDPNFQRSFAERFADFGWGATWLGNRGELNSFNNMALQDVRDCENLISRFLGSELKTSLMGRRAIYPYSSALEVTNRIGQTEDDPNVYSQSGLGSGSKPFPALDFISSAFCRVMQNPNEDQPNVEVGAISPKALESIFQMQREGLTPFYPLINPKTANNYGKSVQEVSLVRSTLGEARRIAGRSLNIQRSFGTGNTLKTVFDLSNPKVKLAIVSTLYPWVHDSDAPFGNFTKRQKTSFAVNLQNRVQKVQSAPLVHTLVLMDFLNREQALMKQTVNYLGWIRSKCARALAVQGSAAFAPQLKKSALQASLLRQSRIPAASSGIKPEFLARLVKQTPTFVDLNTKAVIPPGTTFTGGPAQIQLPAGLTSGRSSTQSRTDTPSFIDTSTAPTLTRGEQSDDGAITETQQFVADTSPENLKITGGEVVAEHRRQQQIKEAKLAEEAHAANTRKRNLYIYIGSGVIACSAIATLVYLKRKE